MKNEQSNISEKRHGVLPLVVGMFFNRLAHIGRKYYAGKMLRGLLENKKGNGVYCDKCGNIANGFEQGRVLGLPYRIPLCNKHLGY